MEISTGQGGINLKNIIVNEPEKQFDNPENKKAAEKNITEEKDKIALENQKNDDSNSRTVKFLDMYLKFSFVDKDSEDGAGGEKKMVVSVVDEQTGEVIRTIPPEEFNKDCQNISDAIGLAYDKMI